MSETEIVSTADQPTPHPVEVKPEAAKTTVVHASSAAILESIEDLIEGVDQVEHRVVQIEAMSSLILSALTRLEVKFVKAKKKTPAKKISKKGKRK